MSIIIDERVAGGRPTRPVTVSVRQTSLGKIAAMVSTLLMK